MKYGLRLDVGVDVNMADRERRLSVGEDEDLDPRIQIELEQLNKASEEINTLELELDDARAAFRQELSESTQKLNAVAKKLGACIDKARPYYDARMRAKEAHIETQKAAVRYERACSMHEAAKEMVHLAEQGYMKRDQPSDPAWQEMLNHATMKVNEAEKERIESEQYHEKTTKVFKEAEESVQQLQKELKRSISKSKPYFEMKVKFNQLMDEQKQRVSHLEAEVINAKAAYAEALRNLESISDEIHERRLEKRKHIQLGVRSAGVGSETPSPPPSHEKEAEMGDGTVVPHISTCTYSSNVLTTPTTYQQSCSKEQITFSVTTTSPTTIELDFDTSQSKDNCDESEGSFVAPSVIFSSPEQARRLSYRQAIECNTAVSPSVTSESISPTDFDEDFDAPSLEEEYMTQPNYKVKGRNQNSFSFKKFSTPVLEHTYMPQATIVTNTTTTTTTTTTNHVPYHQDNQVAVTEVTAVSEKRPMLRMFGKSRSETGPTIHRPNSEVTVGSPSGLRKSKLKGIILRVDTGMDPYMHNVYPCKVSNITHPKNVSPETPTNESQPKNIKNLNSQSSTASPRKMGILNKPCITPTKYVRGPEGSPVLKIPSPASEILDDSDTESLASTGQMLDDDQVELLTLDFSDDTFITTSTAETPHSDHFHKNDWHRMSLPPKLSHLKFYLHSKSVDLTTPTGKPENSPENLEELYATTVQESPQIVSS